MLVINDVFQAFDEPWVYLGQVVNTFDGIAFFQCLCDSEDTEVGGVCQFIVQIIKAGMVVAYEAVHALSYHTQSLLDDFFERTSDGHDFAYRFHTRTNTA